MVEIKKVKAKTSGSINLIIVGIVFSGFYWILEAVRDVFLFDKGNIIRRLFAPDSMSFWMRFLVVCIFVLSSVQAQSLKEKSKAGSMVGIIQIGAVFGVLYWILESFRDTFIFEKGNLFERLFIPDSMGLWMRLLAIFILLLFGVYVQSIINARKRVEEVLREKKEDLEKKMRERDVKLNKLYWEIDVHKKVGKRQARLLEELENVNRELRDFAYVVAHDLKAPLRSIGSLTGLVLKDYNEKLDGKGKQMLQLVIRKVNRMNDLIDGILQYSRVGRVKEEKLKVDLNQLVKKVVDFVDPPEYVDVEVENRLPSLVCEVTRIEQVFQNLVSNAVKYIDKPKGIVKIGCSKENGYWKFRVADNGPGIEEKYFEKIFQVFQTLDPPDKQESTGIGLALVKKIIEMYGGKIWVESEVGSGSTFFFTLPK